MGNKRKGGVSSTSSGSAGHQIYNPDLNKKKIKTAKKKVKVTEKSAKDLDRKKLHEKAVSEPEIESDADEEDVDFFAENTNFSNFLENIDPKTLVDASRKKKQQSPKPVHVPVEHSVQDAEAQPRRQAKNWTPEEISTKLPIKDLDGKLHRPKTTAVESEEEAEESSSESEEDDEISDIEVEEISETIKAPALSKSIQESKFEMDLKEQKKIQMAKLCESILENPEEALKKTKDSESGLSKLQELQGLCRDSDVVISQYAMLSQLTIFHDILPSYRIRVQSLNESPQEDDEASTHQQKKKVKQLRQYESALLSGYQQYLKFMEELIHPTKKTNSATTAALQETAVECLSSLLESKFYFNFSTNLVMTLIPLMNSPVVKIAARVLRAVEHVFRKDPNGQISYEMVKRLSLFIKSKGSKPMDHGVVRCLLALPLRTSMEAGEIARKRVKNDKKKRRKQDDNIATGLKEAEAVVDQHEKQKIQADMLHEIVLIYFRILKQSQQSVLMEPVLEGLMKFSILINLDVMIDVLQVLKVLLKSDILPLPSAFQAVLTCLRTLAGPGKDLMIDEKEYLTHLYQLLWKLPQDVSCFPMALTCIETLFLRRKEISVDRVAAFVRRIAVISSHLPAMYTLAGLSMIRTLFHKYSKLNQLVDESDQDRVASGHYQADVNDPDFCNPFSCSFWELGVLTQHHHPIVAKFAKDTAALAPSLPSETWSKWLEKIDDPAIEDDIISTMVPPASKTMSNKKAKRAANFKASNVVPLSRGMKVLKDDLEASIPKHPKWSWINNEKV